MYRILKYDNKIEDKQYNILLIDYDFPTIRLMTSYFKHKGYTCKGDIGGSKGIEDLRHTTPKLVLLEILLPDLSGYIEKPFDLEELDALFDYIRKRG